MILVVILAMLALFFVGLIWIERFMEAIEFFYSSY